MEDFRPNILLAEIHPMRGRSQVASAWADYRHRRRWFFSAWLGGFAANVVLQPLFRGLSFGVPLGWVLGGGWLLSFFVTLLRLEMFKCPRCQNSFACRSFSFRNPLARSCAHCG